MTMANKKGTITVLGILVIAVSLMFPSRSYSLKNIETGQRLPPFSLPDVNGAIHTDEDVAGSPGAIVFWSTWSPRSAEILEDFRAYHREHAGRGLKILAVNIDGENLDNSRKEKIREYISRIDLPFPVLLDEKLEAFVAYGVMAHPSAVVFDTGGRITFALGGYPDSMRDDLLNNLLEVMGIPVEPEEPEVTSVGYVPRGRALQYYNMGRRLMSKGQHDRALAALKKSSQEDPGFIEPVILTARLMLNAGDADEAESFLGQVSPEDVNRGDLIFLLGNLRFNEGKTAEAEAIFRDLAGRTGDEGWGFWGLGMVAMSKGVMEEALEHMSRARALQPQNLEAETYVGEYFRKRWQKGETAPSEESFIEIFPPLRETRDRYRNLFGPPG